MEAELIHVTSRHAKRAAYMSVCTAEKMGIHGGSLQDLTACALLHDNALTQYLQEKFHGASDMKHTAYAESGDMLVFLFDAAGSIAKEAERKYLCGKTYCCISDKTAIQIREICRENTPADSDRLITRLLGLDTSGNMPRDERIKEVLEYFRELDEIPEDITAQLCARVCLSPSRLSHLFKENVGISLHLYLAMDKMRKGYIYFQKYGSITEASMRAGFDSPSHFAATCKRMFGISFSEFIKSEK